MRAAVIRFAEGVSCGVLMVEVGPVRRAVAVCALGCYLWAYQSKGQPGKQRSWEVCAFVFPLRVCLGIALGTSEVGDKGLCVDGKTSCVSVT